MSLLERLQKVTSVKEADILSESKFFSEKDIIPTRVPLINMALSGEFDGGLTPGVTTIAGPSKHFKTGFAMIMAQAYLDKHKDAVLVYLDSEFGAAGTSYFIANNIDPSRVLHVPITNMEVLKHEVAMQMKEIKRGDHVVFILDSIGNLASLKELDDALEGKTAADFTKAKVIRSFFRMFTAEFTVKNIPFINIAHSYTEIGMYPKEKLAGGGGLMYASDNVWIISRAQEKDGDEITGYKFTINAEKSRYVKEKSKFPIEVSFDGGVNKYSGLLDLALEFGHAAKPKAGWYALVDDKTGEIIGKSYRKSETSCEEFLGTILNRQSFRDKVSQHYKLVFTKFSDETKTYDDDDLVISEIKGE